MEPIVEEFTITLKYQVSVNTETGEMTTKCISRKVDKSNFEVVKDKKKTSKKEECPEPKLYLEDNKYSLNKAAVELMKLTPDCKLDIKYEKVGKKMVPVIGTDDTFGTHNGNKITKANTVACRSTKREELFKFGSEFNIIPHITKEGLFYLEGIIEEGEGEVVEDIEEQDANLEDVLVDDTTEIPSDFFNL